MMRQMRPCCVLQGHPFPPDPAHATCGSTGRNVEAPGICSLHSPTGGLKVFRLMLLIQCYASQGFFKTNQISVLSCLFFLFFSIIFFNHISDKLEE